MLDSPVRLRIATTGDLPRLLSVMAAFNLSEGIAWNEAAVAPAAATLTNDPSLGAIAFIENEAGPVGYCLFTWGYDLEWHGRDAFLTVVRPENRPAVRLYTSAGYVSPPHTFLTKVLRPPAP
jgi:hypothetical protein